MWPLITQIRSNSWRNLQLFKNSMSSAPGDIIGNFTTFEGNEYTKLLQNDFHEQWYITLNATIPGQDRIYPKTHLCRTFFAEYRRLLLAYIF